MDAFLLKQVIAELAAEIPVALVSKVHQPGEREIGRASCRERVSRCV